MGNLGYLGLHRPGSSDRMQTCHGWTWNGTGQRMTTCVMTSYIKSMRYQIYNTVTMVLLTSCYHVLTVTSGNQSLPQVGRYCGAIGTYRTAVSL